jgi:hypothetical protein
MFDCRKQVTLFQNPSSDAIGVIGVLESELASFVAAREKMREGLLLVPSSWGRTRGRTRVCWYYKL